MWPLFEEPSPPTKMPLTQQYLPTRGKAHVTAGPGGDDLFVSRVDRGAAFTLQYPCDLRVRADG